ncbi:MAG: helix-turn-helix transcriptional regulator [Clostridia bacterium]|nr:helix-turn-helix transcriptional regulator [Clostridia bacterium]
MFKNNIRKYREEYGMTREQLADKALISVESIRRYENGAKIPVRTLYLLATILDVGIDELRGLPKQMIRRQMP